jgi:hypothetical protein
MLIVGIEDPVRPEVSNAVQSICLTSLCLSFCLMNRSQKLFDSARRPVLQCAWWRETMSTRLDPSPSSAALSRPEWTI